MVALIEIEAVKDRIVEVIASRLPLRRTGASWVTRCPWHEDRRPSFTVSERKRRWRCWPCGEGGDVIDFLQKYHGTDFKGALEILGIRTENRDPTQTARILKAFEEIGRDENELLGRLEKREDDLCFLARRVNQFLNEPALDHDARWFSKWIAWEFWLAEEFDEIEKERERIGQIARKHRMEVTEWARKAG